MATPIIIPEPQYMAEIRTYPVDFAQDLLSGVTVASATVIHTPPSGVGSVAGTAVSSPFVNVTFGPLSVAGRHYLDVLATCSDAEKLAVRLTVYVPR